RNRRARADRLATGDKRRLVARATLSRRSRDRIRARGRGHARDRGRPGVTPAARHGRARAARAGTRRTQCESKGSGQGSADAQQREGGTNVRRAQLIGMTTVREHYETLLTEHYSRMFGDFESKVIEQRALLERPGVTAPSSSGLAVDLGCGSGFQSIALGRLGFRVRAIDFSQRLLRELTDRARGLPVQATAGDIR